MDNCLRRRLLGTSDWNVIATLLPSIILGYCTLTISNLNADLYLISLQSFVSKDGSEAF